MYFLRFILLLTVLCLVLVSAFPSSKHGKAIRSSSFLGSADEVVDKLPLVDFSLPFKHYSGYLDSIENIKLHYWFFESQNVPKSDPVVLWLNGGPGCSSLFGAFAENGPLLLHKNGTITLNPFSWNRNASVLYLETPVYVGFSLPQKGNLNPPDNTDERTAAQNVAALKSFFAKFPHLQSLPFYITGESYAGRYIPQLAVELLKLNFPLHFKGVAIGNGYLTSDGKLNLFSYYHGITDSVEENGSIDNRLHIDAYNILKEDSNVEDNVLTAYFNRADLQAAIHVHLLPGQGWDECGGGGHYITPIDGNVSAELRTMVDSSKLMVVLYNGDLDAVCNFVGDQIFVEQLGYKTAEERNAWFDYNGRVGGFRKSYAEGRLLFTTVRGAGHMVPTDQPAAALYILNHLLLGLKE